MPTDNHAPHGRKLSVPKGRILLTLSAVTPGILFAWLLYYRSYGLDLTDDGLYPSFIAHLFTNAIYIPPSLFGLVYHWPYQWAGGEIAVLPPAYVTLTIMLGWFLSFLVIRRLWTVGWPRAVVLSAGIPTLARQGPHSQTRGQW